MNSEWQMEVPADLAGGVYANFLSVWHTEHEFTLDFATLVPEEGAALGISRIRVAPTVVFEMMQKINRDLAIYEESYGAIRRPSESEGDT